VKALFVSVCVALLSFACPRVAGDEPRVLVFTVKDGELTPPTGPGLGVEVDETKLNRLVVKDI
jgi:L-alanine-DL-glutamate epimerase-like enolase superfamily enzyme